MPLTSSSKPFFRQGTYIFPTTDLYGQEIPFGKLEGAVAPSSIGAAHRFAIGPTRWQYLHTDSGGVSTYSFPIGG
jgi:hypothetical protein